MIILWFNGRKIFQPGKYSEQIKLSDEDAEVIEELIKNPPKPNKSLKRAKKSHKKLIKDNG